jgi:DNA-binding LacI/PurR family transcriptional regulator
MDSRMIEKRNITSLDVARLAGVSQSAVSRVFTPGASVSPKMTAKVNAAALELGYRPNVLARSLITGKSRIIGVVVAYLENQFYPEVLELLSNSLQASGYHVLMIMASSVTNIDQVMEEIIDYQVDGLVLASVDMSSGLAERCIDAGIPVVLFNRCQDDETLPAVTSDNHAGGRKVANFFIAAQHERIGYIAGWEEASTQRDRERGFVDRLNEQGIKLFAREVGGFDHEEAQEATKRMFSQRPYPDAVFVANDHMAFGVLDTLRFDLGIKVPEEVSVVGYDDVPLASWKAYDLTSVRQPAQQMVEKTIEILLQTENSQSDIKKVMIDGPLMVRGSAKIPDGGKSERF